MLLMLKLRALKRWRGVPLAVKMSRFHHFLFANYHTLKVRGGSKGHSPPPRFLVPGTLSLHSLDDTMTRSSKQSREMVNAPAVPLLPVKAGETMAALLPTRRRCCERARVRACVRGFILLPQFREWQIDQSDWELLLPTRTFL